jgi:hypothetical protein
MKMDGQFEASIRDGDGRKIYEFKPNGGRGNIEQGVLGMLLTIEEKYNVDFLALLAAKREEAAGRA